ncbi:hypothetical protein BV898_19683, partial [Hypsibius exemplaris]
MNSHCQHDLSGQEVTRTEQARGPELLTDTKAQDHRQQWPTRPSESHTSLLHPNRAAKRDVVLAGPTGEVLNVNEARLEYTLKEDDVEENNEIVLDVSVYR